MTAGKPLTLGRSARIQDLQEKMHAWERVIWALVARKDWAHLVLAAEQLLALEAEFEALEPKPKP